LAKEDETKQLRSEIAALRSLLDEHRAEVAAAKDAFGKEFESLRSAIALTEERASASERRAMSDVEAARLAALEAKRALAGEQKRSAAEAVRLHKVVAKREAEIESLRERLAKVESSLASSTAQLKREEWKFSQFLRCVQPTGGPRTRRSA
jgi:chromosome segregation ATPase